MELVPIDTLDRLEQAPRAIFDRGPKTVRPGAPTVALGSTRRFPGRPAMKKIEAQTE
jgi:hypothetical protein